MFIIFTKEIEAQRYGRNKETIVNHNYINSGRYRKKFDSISDNLTLNRQVYQLAKKMLNHRAGTLYEDMYWIDLNTMEIVASEINCEIEEGIIYSDKTKKVISNHESLLTIHSHPHSFPPSITDINSNYFNGYAMGIIICHDGTVYMYKAEEEVPERYYTLLVEEYLKSGYDEKNAQIEALNEIMWKFDIQFKEVTGNDV